MSALTHPGPPPVTPGDRLGLTLCLAIILHALVVLGVSFSASEKSPPRLETMEIILVPERSREADPEADFLAQADLQGGGEAPAPERPSAPLPSVLPAPEPAVVASPPPPSQPPAAEQPEPVVEPSPPAAAAATEAAPEPAPISEPEHLVVATEAPAQAEPRPQAAPAAPAPPESAEDPLPRAEPAPPTAASLIDSSFAIASLQATVDDQYQAQAQRPRRKFVSASTRDYKFAAYMEAWRAKVERVGNLNYPDEARRQRLTGALILDVALKPDGSVEEITIRRSSGHRILDDAAVRIVHLAAPYAPFPDDIRQEVDVLHITRTWQFLNSNRLRSE